MSPAEFRRALESVPRGERDAWLDRTLGIESVPDDGPSLPRGCVPYLPCAIDAIVRAVDLAKIGPSDVVVDLGSGIGRAAFAMHLVTGASAIGVEIQPELVAISRARFPRLTVIEGDATEALPSGTVYFLYCPFGGERLERVLDHLGRIEREIRICCVDVQLPPRPWLSLLARSEGDLVVYGTSTAARETCLDVSSSPRRSRSPATGRRSRTRSATPASSSSTRRRQRPR